MKPTSAEESGETIPLTAGDSQPAAPAAPPYLPVGTFGKTFGTAFMIISTLVAAVLPALQLAFGVYYNGQCPIDQRIPTYMIVSGACGLALAGLIILLAITFLCFISESAVLTILASCGICLNIVISAIVGLFLFIWFIIGCVWIFSVTSSVQFDSPLKTDYCNPVLYKWSFGILVVIFIWSFIQCCISCFRACCVGGAV